MLNRKYLPSFGFVIVVSSLILAATSIFWAFGPLEYQKALAEENLGHAFLKQGNIAEAHKHFLAAAEYSDAVNFRSSRYQWAGQTAPDLADTLKYYRMAIKLNPNDMFFINQIKQDAALNLLLLETNLVRKRKSMKERRALARSLPFRLQ